MERYRYQSDDCGQPRTRRLPASPLHLGHTRLRSTTVALTRVASVSTATPTTTSPTSPEPIYNPYAFAVHDNPYVIYTRLRDEAPAYWNPELRFWALSRFDDVLEGFRDFETFSSMGGVALESRRNRSHERPPFEQMIEMDPPDHTVFRKLVSRVFTVLRMAEMEDDVRDRKSVV